MTSRCDAAVVVAERVHFWQVLAEDQARALAVTLAPGPALVGLDASDLADLVDVVVDNVFAHTAEGTAFAITLRATPTQVVLEVTDDGGAAAVEPVAEGRTGLGLQIVRRAVAAAAGTVSLDPSGTGGTRVRIVLPRISG